MEPMRMAGPMYPAEMTDPMRQEMTDMGVKELRTPEEVDAVLKDSKGTVLVVVNSVCGCAAGHARPSVRLALENDKRPEQVVTVFAGVDKAAVDQARSYFHGFRPSSPSMALFKDGEVVSFLERHHIESSNAEILSDFLKNAFNTHCS